MRYSSCNYRLINRDNWSEGVEDLTQGGQVGIQGVSRGNLGGGEFRGFSSKKHHGEWDVLLILYSCPFIPSIEPDSPPCTVGARWSLQLTHTLIPSMPSQSEYSGFTGISL